ncbi:MAG: 2,5-diamino-6-(ribosylamino)-4(3H)-pyrimidinone 5'-phosphate reductase [Nitrososphaeraceae archaeon]|jgi:2,5-diamino-6-(ribosylamino)-4(3H)-pyrimidinone 5'-phosphate reductase
MYVIINSAMTVDGKIATIRGNSTVSSMDDLRRVHSIRSSVDGIVVGISTVLMDNPRLTARLAKICRKEPARVIIDSTARIPLDSRILKTADRIKTIIAVTTRANTSRIKKIQNTGAMVITAGTEYVNLKMVFALLKKLGFKKILVEGGGEINWSILKLGIANELIVTIAPRIVGGRSAITIVEGDGYSKMSEGIRLKLKRIVKQDSGEMVLYYKI